MQPSFPIKLDRPNANTSTLELILSSPSLRTRVRVSIKKKSSIVGCFWELLTCALGSEDAGDGDRGVPARDAERDAVSGVCGGLGGGEG